MSEDTSEKYIIRTRKGFIWEMVGTRNCQTIMFYLTPDLEKAKVFEDKGEAIELAAKMAMEAMGPVIKKVIRDPITWKRKTIGTVVF